MHSLKLNIPNLEDFRARAELSIDSHLAFARFVEEAGDYSGGGPSGELDEASKRYRIILVDLEVINASALDAWEAAGQPGDWSSQWATEYKGDAREVIAELQALIDTL